MRVLVFGNSGSGKSYFAQGLGAKHGVPVLDLDRVVWSDAAVFRPDAEIVEALHHYVQANSSWIIEGCYGRWMSHLFPHATEIVFLNPGEATCLSNCRARPWEPHKYPSKEAQDSRLAALLDWVRGYYSRSDDMSLQMHRQLFDSYQGRKLEITANASSA